MKNTRIFIARHGETELNRLNIIQGSKDADLNEMGRLQAQTLAHHFSDIPLDLICSSTMKRAVQTAQAVADIKTMEVGMYSDLREMNFGDYEGLNYPDIEAGFNKLKVAWAAGNFDFACRNGESPRQVIKRADPCLRSIVKENKGKNILFVLHGRLIRILFTMWFKWDLKMMNTFETPNVAYSVLEWNEGGFIPVELNVTSHLIDISTVY